MQPFLKASNKNAKKEVDSLTIPFFNELPFTQFLCYNKKELVLYRSVILLWDKDRSTSGTDKNFILEAYPPWVKICWKELILDVQFIRMPYIRTMNSRTLSDDDREIYSCCAWGYFIVFSFLFRSFRATLFPCFVVIDRSYVGFLDFGI